MEWGTWLHPCWEIQELSSLKRQGGIIDEWHNHKMLLFHGTTAKTGILKILHKFLSGGLKIVSNVL